MNQNTETVPVFVGADEIADAGVFEELRLQAAGETASKPGERALTMSELAAAADTVGGTNLADALVERVQSETANISADEALRTAKQRLRTALGATATKEQTLYRFNVNPETGEVASILKQTVLAEDTNATKENSRKAARVPWGKAHNTINLGGTSGDHMGRRHHR